MMANTLMLLSVVFFVVAGICFLISVFTFFKFKIVSVIGDLSGKNAKKSIEKMRQLNEKRENKSYLLNANNVKGEKIKSKKSSELIDSNVMPETSILDDKNERLFNFDETSALDEMTEKLCQETELLDDATMRLDNETADLVEVTTSLEEEIGKKQRFVKIALLDEIEYVHINESL